MMDVDECKSSVTCHCCQQRLTNMKADTTKLDRRTGVREVRRSRVHKVLHCKPSDGDVETKRCMTTWNRDINAAKNILMLGMHQVYGWERPSAFRRAVDSHRPT
jgi:transposase